MVKSDLATKVVEAYEGNYSKGRNGQKVCKITPHHMAGVLTAEQCAKTFQNPAREASANYCIGNDGEIVCGVSEENRAWTSSSRTNDQQAITIEVSNCENGGQWKVSDAAWNSLVNLCVDICKRYNFRLTYDGTPNGSLTRHNMFYNTNCPGPYLQSRLAELADVVNAILDGKTEEQKSKITYQVYDNVKKKWLNNITAGEGNGIMSYAGNFGNSIGGLKIDKLKYRVHDKVKNKWLNWIEGRNGEGIMSYAGNLGNAIDGLQIENAIYRVHLKGGDWLSWITKVDDTPQGYAGIYGKEIDAIQIQ